MTEDERKNRNPAPRVLRTTPAAIEAMPIVTAADLELHRVYVVHTAKYPHCDELIADSDRVFPFSVCAGGQVHYECGIRTVLGSAAHQLGECTCYGGTRDDPPGLTRRQAAQLACETFRILDVKN